MKKEIAEALNNALNAYAPINQHTWQRFTPLCKVRELDVGEALYCAGIKPKSFAFVFRGLMRTYITDENGHEYNKNFFAEHTFPGSMSALLTDSVSRFTVDALEQTLLVEIDFKGYRTLLHEQEDLKLFHIYYLEKNWLLHKDAREVDIVQLDASQRYIRFLKEYEPLAHRLPQYHIASHLGITPTQLSRIRKKLNQHSA